MNTKLLLIAERKRRRLERAERREKPTVRPVLSAAEVDAALKECWDPYVVRDPTLGHFNCAGEYVMPK